MLENIINSGSALRIGLIAGGMALFSFGSCRPQDEPKQPIAKPAQSQPIEKSQPRQPEPPQTLQALQTQQNPIADNYLEPKPKPEIITYGKGTLRDETFELTRGKAELIVSMLQSSDSLNGSTTGTKVEYKIKNISDKKVRINSIDGYLYEGDELKLRNAILKHKRNSDYTTYYIDPKKTLEESIKIDFEIIQKGREKPIQGLALEVLAPGETTTEYSFSTAFKPMGKLDKINIVITTDTEKHPFTSYIPEEATFPDTK